MTETNLTDRVNREKESYDKGTVFDESAKLHARFHHVFKGPDSKNAEAYFNSLIKHVGPGKAILSYGTVRGQELMPALIEAKPRRLVVIDISENEIEATRKDWANQADFMVMDGHAMTFPDRSFDLVVGRAILHHLDYNVAMKEIVRVLRPGGVALFVEPLRGNPLLRLARALTPKARTVDEMPLSRKQVLYGDQMFGKQQHLFFNFFSVPVGMLSSLLFEAPDNLPMRWAHQVDRLLSTTVLKYWMRSVVLVWERKA